MPGAVDPSEGASLIVAAAAGDPHAPAKLIPLVYANLRRLARRYLARQGGAVSIGPTDLVHEAYLRLAAAAPIDWQGKTHFFSIAATQMRRLLVDLGRRRAAEKRGGGRLRITLGDDVAPTPARVLDLLALDEALRGLAERSERQHRIAELRLFGGLLLEEVAHVLSLSERTVRAEWQAARAWLAQAMNAERGESDG
jgi:RNA polymerase sigma factor (TIGR02999 family)